ncbi:hypothetical protein M2281_003902 [Mesorhizobium soli]|uniref:hypothetical protein n=1 Tax=Pseudaminobacter soli (ex Li et al. 2025) TaxID=1295366 RepID=UPI002473E6CE|nr:hypothetical protein [Mesorhizobium soli]MDH6233291.1 hypothetical protein [Mesorhizobium soli]
MVKGVRSGVPRVGLERADTRMAVHWERLRSLLGCTMEIGFYKEIERELGVPVIDPSIAALKRAEYAALLKRQCGWVPSRKGSCEAPSEAELAAFNAFGGDDPIFGSRFVIPAD